MSCYIPLFVFVSRYANEKYVKQTVCTFFLLNMLEACCKVASNLYCKRSATGDASFLKRSLITLVLAASILAVFACNVINTKLALNNHKNVYQQACKNKFH